MKKIIICIIALSMIIGVMTRCSDRVEIPEGEPIIMENPTEPKCIVGIVNVHKLNVRKEPSTTSDVLRQLDIRACVEILEQKVLDGILWGRIDCGWINLTYVDIDDEDYMVCENCGTYLNK